MLSLLHNTCLGEFFIGNFIFNAEDFKNINFSESHRENDAYLNAKYFKDDDILKVTQTIANLSKIIETKESGAVTMQLLILLSI